MFTEHNVRSIRPGYGLHTRHLDEVLGRTATSDIERGTPLNWELVGAKGIRYDRSGGEEGRAAR